MEISDNMSFTDLQNRCWSGAENTLEVISEAGLEDELMDYLENCFVEGGIPSLTEVNDYLWFEADEILDALGIEESDEEY